MSSTQTPETFLPNADQLYAELRLQVSAFVDSHTAAADSPPITLVGIASGGAWLAERLHAELAMSTPLGIVSSALHRDDFRTKGVAQAQRTSLPFSVDEAHVLLVDDVLHTGRTIRAVINELYDFGRPRRVSLAVLVDRGSRELPIAADLCAARITLGADEQLSLFLEDGRFAFARQKR